MIEPRGFLARVIFVKLNASTMAAKIMHQWPVLLSSESHLFVQDPPFSPLWNTFAFLFLIYEFTVFRLYGFIYLSVILILHSLVSVYVILSLHCSLLNLQRSPEALKPYTATESYLLCVSGVSCHGEKIPFEVWPPSFTLTIMLLALSCPPCKAHVFSFVQLPLPHSCTPPGFPLLCHSLSHCYPFTVRRSGPNLIPLRHAGKCSQSLGSVGSIFRDYADISIFKLISCLI